MGSWQSYLNAFATVGRSLGGPLGGFLADTIGWRCGFPTSLDHNSPTELTVASGSFFGQAPIFLLAMVCCGIILPNMTTGPYRVAAGVAKSHLARIDFLGAAFLGSGLLSVLLPLRLAGQKVPWTSPIIPSLFALGVILLALFVVTEMRWAKEPILPLRLLRNRELVFSYLIMACQVSIQRRISLRSRWSIALLTPETCIWRLILIV